MTNLILLTRHLLLLERDDIDMFFWRKKKKENKVGYTNDYAWAETTFETSYCNAIKSILSRIGFDSLSVMISDDKHGVTVLGQYQGISFALFFSCHSATLDVPDVQLSTLEAFKNLETGHYDKDKIQYVLRYSFEEIGFVDVSTSDEDDIIHVIAHKDDRTYSFTFKCPFWTITPRKYSDYNTNNMGIHKSVNSTHTYFTNSPARRDEYSFDKMDGHRFEEYCADLLKRNGYHNVKVTQGSGDQGIDITAHKGGKKYGIQCKRYASKIGNKAVQEVHAGKAIYNCDIGVVLTNNYFTKAAVDLAKATHVELWDRRDLLQLKQNADK